MRRVVACASVLFVAGCAANAPGPVSTIAPGQVPTSAPAAGTIEGPAVQTGWANVLARLNAEIKSLADVRARLDVTTRLEAAVNKLENNVTLQARDVTGTIGGGGDSVTAWIYASGAVACMLFYPVVWRPLRRWREKRTGRHADARGPAGCTQDTGNGAAASPPRPLY